MKENKRSICHCAYCEVESDCAANDWFLANDMDPCCPNMKKLRKQMKAEYEQWLIDQKMGW